MATKPRKMKSYASFVDWKSDQTQENMELIDSLQKLVEEVSPRFSASVKWGQGCWLEEGVPKVYIHAEPDHVQLGFYAGSSLDDPKGLLAGKGKHVRHVKVRIQNDIDVVAFTDLIMQVRKPDA